MLSAILSQSGHEIHLIFYGEYDHTTYRGTTVPNDEPSQQAYLKLIEEIRPDAVGFSFRCDSAWAVHLLTDRLRSKGLGPILYGGMGATCDPETEIQHADAVCVGEADTSLLELANRWRAPAVDFAPIRSVPNFWIRTSDGVIRNPVAPLVTNLNGLPLMDYSQERKYSIVRGNLVRNDGRYDNPVGAYPLLTSRGCPRTCTFCHNSLVHRLYKGTPYCRQRSVDHVMEELRYAKSRPDTHMVSIYDDLFTYDRRWILEFARRYREEIALPFWCFTYPDYVEEEGFRELVKAGLNAAHMGVQSGSLRTLREIYRRPTKLETIRRAASILKPLPIQIQIDLITGNPLETDDDRKATLDFLISLPRNTNAAAPHERWHYGISRLTLYPNAEITNMIKERGLPVTCDSDETSFWEMLYRLTLVDGVDPDALRRLSNNFDAYRSEVGDYSEEAAIRYVKRNRTAS